MKLKDYFENYGIRSGWFAKQIPCSGAYICCVAAEKSYPSPMMMKRIEELTDGKVMKNDFGEKFDGRKRREAISRESK